MVCIEKLGRYFTLQWTKEKVPISMEISDIETTYPFFRCEALTGKFA